MRNLETTTRLDVDEAMVRIRSFFGKGGLGLDLTEEEGNCLTFNGGGGYVRAAAGDCQGGTTINLVTQEWEHQIDRFAGSLPRTGRKQI